MAGPAEVWFYQVPDGQLTEAMAALLERCLARPWRVAVIADGRARLEEVDEALWGYRDDSFLPHGPVDDPAADQFPIVIGGGWTGADREATLVMDGCELSIGEGVARCMVLFEESSPARAIARDQWKQAREGGHMVAYWVREAGGAWVQKA